MGGEWFSLDQRRPEPGQAVIVKAEDWRIPRVLEFDLKAGHPRLIDRMSGRFFWYPERMRWTHIPADSAAGTDGGTGNG